MMAQPESPQQTTITLGQLLPGVVLSGDSDQINVSELTADSRRVSTGSVFVACPGLQVDGRNYIPQAIESGAVAVLAEAEGLADTQWSVPVIPVSRLAHNTSAIAGTFYGEPSQRMRVSAVTGTNGKTTCSQLLAQLLTLLGEPSAVVGTLGYGMVGEAPVETGMTTPDAIRTQKLLAQLHSKGAKQLCMEVSSHSLDQGRVSGVQFHTAVFTNLSRDHLDYHGDMDSYCAAKSKLFQQSGLQLAVINSDDPASEKMVRQLPESARCLRYGINDHASVDVRASKVELTAGGVRAWLNTPWGQGELRSSLLAEFNVSNLLAVITAACGQGWPLEQVLAAVPKLQAVEGRMQLVNTQLAAELMHPTVVVDYAHTPDALEQALRALRHHCRGRLWCVFGCGGDRDAGKRPQMGEIAARLSDCAVVTSDNPRHENPDQIIVDILAGMPDSLAVRVAPNRADAIREAIACAEDNDCVLIAGKGHERYQDIAGNKTPFSDTEEACQVLLERAAQTGEESDYAH